MWSSVITSKINIKIMQYMYNLYSNFFSISWHVKYKRLHFWYIGQYWVIWWRYCIKKLNLPTHFTIKKHFMLFIKKIYKCLVLANKRLLTLTTRRSTKVRCVLPLTPIKAWRRQASLGPRENVYDSRYLSNI